MDLLNESERRFTKKLCDAMIPVMIEAFWEIWLEAKKESQGKNTTRVFQELLRGVKTWNSSISLKNTEAIVKNQPLFPNLLAAVFVIHVKILSSIRTDRKSKKISIKLPANDVFVQRCYEACAKDLYENPSIIVDNKPEEERDTNLNERFHKRICVVIEDLIPTAEILNTYLPLPAAGEDLDMDHEDEDPEGDEDVPDLEDDVPMEEGNIDSLPQNTGNMEFGKTPGGVDTAVTVNNSLTPPSVPGATPAPAEDEGESLFSDAPTKIQKLNHT
jgi:GTPase SAR1 family protein